MTPKSPPRPTDAAQPVDDPQLSASSRVTSRDGTLTLSGRDGHARHTHGGPAARLGQARFLVENASSRIRKLRATVVEELTEHGCAPPSVVRSRPKLAELAIVDSDTRSGTEVSIPAQTKVEIVANFAPVHAYMAFCDRFAFRVSFELDGSERLSAVAETHVTRMEPWRR